MQDKMEDATLSEEDRRTRRQLMVNEFEELLTGEKDPFDRAVIAFEYLKHSIRYQGPAYSMINDAIAFIRACPELMEKRDGDLEKAIKDASSLYCN
jgi:hypothetical protein